MSLPSIVRRSTTALGLILAAGLVAAGPAAAHPADDPRLGGWLDGFLHPFLGLDHLAAMLAVGAIAALAVRRLPLWSTPAAFVGAMVAGGAVGVAGAELGGVETIIAASVLIGGLVLLAAKQAPIGWWLLPLVAVAGVAHGNAHGLEAPAAAAPAAYVVGFVLATSILHAAGAIAGVAMRRVDLGRIVGGVVLAGFGTALIAA
ncbi:MAG: HupE/UreJ family protein [Acidimicrobiales bacterium]